MKTSQGYRDPAVLDSYAGFYRRGEHGGNDNYGATMQKVLLTPQLRASLATSRFTRRAKQSSIQRGAG